MHLDDLSNYMQLVANAILPLDSQLSERVDWETVSRQKILLLDQSIIKEGVFILQRDIL